MAYGALAAAIIGAAASIHSTQEQKQGQKRAIRAQEQASQEAEDASKRAQTQAGQAPLQNFSRRRKMPQGFDPAQAAQLVAPAGDAGAGGALLGS